MNSRKVRVYVYEDAKGKPRLRKIRKEPKHFIMECWVHSPRLDYWKTGTEAQAAFAPKALYRLPELLWALRDGEPVYWCEGEKDADATHGLGHVATSHWQGATNATEQQAAWFTRGNGESPIYLVADDDPAGSACIIRRRSLLWGVGIEHDRIKLLAPPRKYDDATEAIQAGCVDLDEWRLDAEQRTEIRLEAQTYRTRRTATGERGESDWGLLDWKPTQVNGTRVRKAQIKRKANS